MTDAPLPPEQMGPAERLLGVVLNSSAHLWHNRPGIEVDGAWLPARGNRGRVRGTPIKPGLHVSAAVRLYSQLLEIYQLNAELMARFASHALLETDWRDLKVACCGLMLVQPISGQPVRAEDGSIDFYDDDYRVVGEAMILHYQKGSKRMMTPKALLRVAQLLETPEIASLNRDAGFADPASKKAPLGRWKSAVKKWLAYRELNIPMLDGLVRAGFKETIKNLARKSGYKPQSQSFFEILGWKQKQSSAGHRTVGMGELKLRKLERFDGFSEREICEWIVKEKLSFKEVVGRLPSSVGLTPAIMVTLLPSLSNRDLRILTPTIEELGLLEDAEIRSRWERAIQEATDQRALNIAKNVKNRALREKLEEAADHAAKKAVEEATKDLDLRVMFLIDKSGSMEKAIEQSKEALTRILAGFPPEKVHIASFDTMGTVLVPKSATRKGVEHMLKSIRAGGGTQHGAAVSAFRRDGVEIPEDATLLMIVVGDEAGENGARFASTIREAGYNVRGLAMIVCVAEGWRRGHTVRRCAGELQVPFLEVGVEQFDDPYQVTRVLETILEAPVPAAGSGGTIAQSRWVEKVMATKILGQEVPIE